MELRQIRHFATVVKMGSVHKAALALNLAQPALSVSIRKLEEELRLKLFDRNQKGSTVTSAGLLALKLALEIEALTIQLRNISGHVESGGLGTLKISYVTSAAGALVPELSSRFRKSFPLVKLVLSEATTQEIIERLNSEDIDIGIVRTPIKNTKKIDTYTAKNEILHLAINKSHPLSIKKSVPLEILSEDNFIFFDEKSSLRHFTNECCNKAGFSPTIFAECSHITTIVGLVNQNMGVAIMGPPTFIHEFEFVKFVPVTLKGENIRTSLDIAVRRNDPNPLIRNFVQFL